MKADSEIRALNSGDAQHSYHSQFSIGGVTVEISGMRPEDVGLVPSLKLFQTDFGRCDVNIRVEWAAELHSSKEKQLFDSGTTWRCYQDDGGLRFDFSSPAFGGRPYKRLHVDRRFERATLRMNRAVFADFAVEAEPLEYPLDELLIMHRLTQENAIELHGCGIVRSDGAGRLFVGHSGGGKSTTARLWTERESVEVLSDDRIILRPEENGLGSSPKSIDAAGERRIRMYGTPWHGEAMYASPSSGPLQAIFILEHGNGNRLTELAPGEAVAELFARSFVPFHRHEYVDVALQFLQELVAAVPCYRYAFEPDQSAVDTILNFQG
jgi:hypothetical protein